MCCASWRPEGGRPIGRRAWPQVLGLGLLLLGAPALTGCTGDPERRGPAMARPGPALVETIDAAALAALVEAGAVVLIDVRTPYEFADGRIAGALNAPLTHFDPATIPRDATRETILYCGTQRRSQIAAEQLARHLGGTVRHLAGGIAGWEQAGLPLVANSPADDPRQR